MNRFKTLEQLLEEQEGVEEIETQPIVFTDHTGRKQTTHVLGEPSVNRNAVGFEVANESCFDIDDIQY